MKLIMKIRHWTKEESMGDIDIENVDAVNNFISSQGSVSAGS